MEWVGVMYSKASLWLHRHKARHNIKIQQVHFFISIKMLKKVTKDFLFYNVHVHMEARKNILFQSIDQCLSIYCRALLSQKVTRVFHIKRKKVSDLKLCKKVEMKRSNSTSDKTN